MWQKVAVNPAVKEAWRESLVYLKSILLWNNFKCWLPWKLLDIQSRGDISISDFLVALEEKSIVGLLLATT